MTKGAQPYAVASLADCISAHLVSRGFVAQVIYPAEQLETPTLESVVAIRDNGDAYSKAGGGGKQLRPLAQSVCGVQIEIYARPSIPAPTLREEMAELRQLVHAVVAAIVRAGEGDVPLARVVSGEYLERGTWGAYRYLLACVLPESIYDRAYQKASTVEPSITATHTIGSVVDPACTV